VNWADLGDALVLLGAGRRALEGLSELRQVSKATDAAEALRGVEDRSAGPALEHRAAAPTLHVPSLGRDGPVQILDHVGAAKRAVERSAYAESLQGQSLVQAFADGGRRIRMLGLQGACETLQTALGEICILQVPSLAKSAAHRRMKCLGKMSDDIPVL